ncbi:reverse transcriptase domain-containing protein [Tanacetum coccineum]
MAISVISVSSESSSDSVGTPTGRVILFEIPIIAPTIPPSPDYTSASLDYSSASETESDLSKDPSSDHIPPLPAILPFLSSAVDTTDSDTPDTPPSPTYNTPFTEITSSTQRSPVIPHRRVMILAPGQHIPHGRPYRYHPNRPASSDFHSDASSDSLLRHLLSDHSSPDLSSTSAGLSHKRRRSPMTSVPALPPVFGALSLVRADLIPSPKRVRGSDEPHLEQDINPEIQAEIDECFAYADALRDRGIDTRVVVEAVDDVENRRCEGHRFEVIEGVQREQGHRIVRVESAVTALTKRIAELEMDNRRLRGTVSVESQRVDRLQRGMSCMQRELRQIRRLRFYDRVRVGKFEACARKHMGFRPKICSLVLQKIPNTRSRASRTHMEIEDLIAHRVAEEMEAREAAMNLEPLNENGDEQEGGNGNGGNGNGGNGGNGNRGNRGNGNGGNEGNGNEGNGNGGNGGNGNGGNEENGNGNRNMNHGMNYGGFMPVAQECTFQDFLKCKPQNFSGTEGVGNVIVAEPTKLQDAIRIANNLIDQKLKGCDRSAENKRRLENNPRDNHGLQLVFKRQNVGGQNVARAYTARNNKRKGYVGPLPYCNKCRLHHEGLCTIRCGNYKNVGHLTRDCRAAIAPNTQRATVGNQPGVICYECGRPGHFRKDCPKLRNKFHGNQTRNKNGNKTENQTGGNEATTKAYAIGGGGTNLDSNVVTGMFLLNNCYASMLFNSGADISFVSSTFSTFLDVAPSTLDTSYAVELADGRIS